MLDANKTPMMRLLDRLKMFDIAGFAVDNLRDGDKVCIDNGLVSLLPPDVVERYRRECPKRLYTVEGMLGYMSIAYVDHVLGVVFSPEHFANTEEFPHG